MRSIHETLQESGRRGGVHVHVALDLVHRLPDADCSGEVHDRVDTRQRLLDQVGIADVSLDECDPCGEGGLRSTVNLRLEAVDDDYLGPFVHEARDEV